MQEVVVVLCFLSRAHMFLVIGVTIIVNNIGKVNNSKRKCKFQAKKRKKFIQNPNNIIASNRRAPPQPTRPHSLRTRCWRTSEQLCVVRVVVCEVFSRGVWRGKHVWLRFAVVWGPCVVRCVFLPIVLYSFERKKTNFRKFCKKLNEQTLNMTFSIAFLLFFSQRFITIITRHTFAK